MKEIFETYSDFNKWLLELTESEKETILSMIREGYVKGYKKGSEEASNDILNNI